MVVPIDLLKPILADLKSAGRANQAPRPWLGVSTDERQRGILVSRVSPEGPGDAAGVRAGDVIVAVNGTAVETVKDFYKAVWSGAVGTVVRISVMRDDEPKTLRVRSIDRMTHFKPMTTL